MKFLAVLLLAFLVFHAARGQLTISGDAGYGSFRMKDMKLFQEQVRAGYPVDARVTASFPSYWYYEGSAKWFIGSKFQLGGSFAYGSTGGRVYYSDYSGRIGSDQLLSYQSYRLVVSMQKNFLGRKLMVEGDLRPGITISDLMIKSYYTLSGASQETESVFHSTNLIIQPTVSLGTRFGFFGVHGFVGYNLSLAQGSLTSTDGTILQNSRGDVHADWSGLRAGGGLSVFFKKPTTQPGSEKTPRRPINSSLGIGIGLDYGGIGFNIAAYPGKYIGIFGGGGWALAGPGYNVGVKLRFDSISSPKASAFVMGMYGYNAAIVVSNAPSANKLFYGSTVGLGVDFANRREGRGHWTIALLVPIRDSGVNEYINLLKSSGIKFNNSLLPVTISIGYRLSNE
jgi:hypothetical protein